MTIRVFDIIDGITKLGPGVRFGIWTQGCLRKCAGCMTPGSQPLDGGYLVDVDSLVNTIKQSGKTELTISGGEPFLQTDALSELLIKLRKDIDIGVIVYTGFTYEEIRLNNGYSKLLDQCDLIIDGAYEESLNDGKNLRGSSNQKAVLLSDRYRDFIKEFGAKPAEVEFFVYEDKISMVGVPSREILEKIKKYSL